MKFLFFFALITSFFSCNKNIEAKYIGAFEYKIFNETLHKNNSYLSEDSYGYVITDLDLKECGIEILGIENLNRNEDYIVTINYPILEIKTNSKKIRNEGVGKTKKKPIDVILDKKNKSNKVYIYKLDIKGQYRLLQG